MKFRLGLFENPYPYSDNAEAVWKDPEHKKLGVEAALESMTLIRNDGALPLQLNLGDVSAVDRPAAFNFDEAYTDVRVE